MLRANFNKETKLKGQDLAWRNICVASYYGQNLLASSAAAAWLLADKTKTLQDLELKLRNEGVELWLIAAEVPDPDEVPEAKEMIGFQPVAVHGHAVEYICIFSCTSRDEALIELLCYAGTYEENFNRLPDAGFLVPKDKSYLQLLEEHRESLEPKHRIIRNEVELEFVDVDPNDAMLDELAQAREKYGQEPCFIIHAVSPDAAVAIMKPIVLVPDKEKEGEDKMVQISQLGMLVGYDPYNNPPAKMLKIVFLDDKKSWCYAKEKDLD